MSSLIPIYLKTYYKNDYYFNNTKIVLSVYNEEDYALNETVGEKLKFDNISDIEVISQPSSMKFVTDSMQFVDVVLKGDEFLNDTLEQAYKNTTSEKSEYLDVDSISKIY